MRVLVIEDDDAIRSVVERGLRAEGFDVDACTDGVAGLWKLLEGGYAAVVLDLLLPGMNGYTVCARARAEGVTTPILVLTAKNGEYDQMRTSPWILLFPSLFLSLAVLAFIMLGDAVRDAFDPKGR